MKKTLIAALAIAAMASCNKEITAADPTAPVAATFTAASITRVANNAWVENDKIGVSMTKSTSTASDDVYYENTPYTVDATDLTKGIFKADNDVIYFPVDGSTVDFYAYYPQSTLNEGYKTITVSVANQGYAHIDLVAATASASKTSPTVTFAFTHQLSKLTMNIVAGDGIDALTDIVATIKGHYTSATYDIYTSTVTAVTTVAKAPITALTKSTTAADGTTPATAVIEAILIPTSAISGSTIEFAVGGNVYYLDTKDFVFEKSNEYIYTITLTRTGATISGATISSWGNGTEVSNGVLDASDYVAVN